MIEDVFRETTADARTQSVPLSHLSLEIGHLYSEDFERGPDRLREHFALARPWADAAAASAVAGRAGRRPRISTCFLIDDYFSRFSSPADVVPPLLAEAARAGLTIDYLVRESGCAVADGFELARSVADRLVESPPPGSNGGRPPARRTGWLANGRRGPTGLVGHETWQPPEETLARRHSVFLDTELWDDDGPVRIWSCAFLAAVWQLLRLGLLRHDGSPVLRPALWDGRTLPGDWDELPALLQVNAAAEPFAAYRTCSLLPYRFLPVEHAVMVVLDQTDVEPEALAQSLRRAADEGIDLPASVAERAGYVFYPGP
ncbi:SCO2522 family protein [Streptomyces sp. NPDC027717]|uniref:SCO2522 family protein n=1 Tax=Streptomyces sp. NPDC027717 TaxID=3155765 RepID=UPI003406E351